MSIQYVDQNVAPEGEETKWNYTLDTTNKTITLNQYTGTDEDVVVYSNYSVDGECYKTKIGNNDEGSNSNYMFTRCSNIKNIVFQKGIDTSDTSSMSYMFYICKALTSLDISNLDTSNVTNMSNMFSGCKALTSLDLSSFDTSNVTNMDSMFQNCSGLTEISVTTGKWVINNKICNITDMFTGCGVSSVTYKDAV